MRLLKIGRDASCNIVLHSDRVSSLHAELTLLNSGDITIEDKGSRNGTFVMNQQIKPGKPVTIRRGDAIRFADVELQWSQVPMPEDNSAYRAIYGVGSHFSNDIQISGATVSRYHATIKHGKDGKIYIVDHSKNGTTVDGVKITPNTPYRLKKKSAVVCGGVPVDTSRLNIWPNEAWKTIVGVAASIALLAGIGYGLWKIIIVDPTPSLKALEKATACVIEQYYIEVRFKDDPLAGKCDPKKWPEKWVFGRAGDKLALGTLTNIEISPITAKGTAFFISEHGELGTNRHIARPWEYNAELREMVAQEMQKLLLGDIQKYVATLMLSGEVAQLKSYEDVYAIINRLNKSEIEISGSIQYMGLVLTNHNFTTIADLAACQVIAVSEDDKKDVALIRLNNPVTPKEIVDGGFFDITKARVDETSLLPQEEELTTMGYPAEFGTDAQIVGDGKVYLPTVHRTYVSVAPDENQFQLQSNVVGGQSGSPIIDSKRRLVGVVWGSHRGTEVAYGCNIKHLKELYDKNKIRK